MPAKETVFQKDNAEKRRFSGRWNHVFCPGDVSEEKNRGCACRKAVWGNTAFHAAGRTCKVRIAEEGLRQVHSKEALPKNCEASLHCCLQGAHESSPCGFPQCGLPVPV